MRYAAFFRGINVGGKNIVKMADLKQLFTNLGFEEVKTYIQSGNIIFSSEADRTTLPSLISEAFEKQFGFRSAVVIRSDTEIADIIKFKPFQTAEIEAARKKAPDVEHLYIYLSDAALNREDVKQLCGGCDGEDKIFVTESEIYLLCAKSIRDSKLAVLLTKLPQNLTARNLKTMGKIGAMFDK